MFSAHRSARPEALPAVVFPRTPRTAVKVTKADGDRVTLGGHLVVFDDAAAPVKDLAGEYFTADTYFGARKGDGSDCLFHHGVPLKAELAGLADVILPPLKVTADEVGLFAEVVLDMSDAYQAAIVGLARKGALGWSSGSAPHMVKIAGDGRIERWPIIEGSLTPTPCEPRTSAAPLKSVPLDALAGPFADRTKAESLTARVSAVYDAFYRMADAAGDWNSYVAEVWDDFLIVRVSSVVAEGHYRVAYAYAGGVATLAPLAEWERVQPATLGREWEAVKAAYEAHVERYESGAGPDNDHELLALALKLTNTHLAHSIRLRAA